MGCICRKGTELGNIQLGFGNFFLALSFEEIETL